MTIRAASAAPLSTIVALAALAGCAPAPSDTGGDAAPRASTDDGSAPVPVDGGVAPDDAWPEIDGPLYENVAARAGLAGAPFFGRGASWIDIDGDGWEDLWLSDNGTGAPGYTERSRLYRNRGDGTFERFDDGIADEDLVYNWSGAWGDYDNDGDPDVFLVNGSFSGAMHCALYRNDVARGGRFVNVSSAAGILPDPRGWWGASPADIDNDGDLDLVVTTVAAMDENMDWSLEAPIALYRNRGDGTFTEDGAASGLGLIHGNVKNPVWIDYDKDGDPDLYVAGMQDQRLFENDGAGHFTDVTSRLPMLPGTEPHVWSAAAEDFDQDGWDDLFLGRWDQQDYVLLNQHDGTWRAVGRDAGLDMQVGDRSPEDTMGLGVGDIDDDGWPDVLIGPGAPWYAAPPIVYCNDGNASLHFHRCSAPMVAGHGAARHHGIALADYNHDGATDIVYSLGGMIMSDTTPAEYPSLVQQPALYVQHPPSPPATAVVHLVGTASNRSAIGARVEVDGATRHYYTIRGAQGFQSQNADWVPVFLGGGDASATIHWPSGRTSLVDLARGQRVTITEPR